MPSAMILLVRWSGRHSDAATPEDERRQAQGPSEFLPQLAVEVPVDPDEARRQPSTVRAPTRRPPASRASVSARNGRRAVEEDPVEPLPRARREPVADLDADAPRPRRSSGARTALSARVAKRSTEMHLRAEPGQQRRHIADAGADLEDPLPLLDARARRAWRRRSRAPSWSGRRAAAGPRRRAPGRRNAAARRIRAARAPSPGAPPCRGCPSRAQRQDEGRRLDRPVLARMRPHRSRGSAVRGFIVHRSFADTADRSAAVVRGPSLAVRPPKPARSGSGRLVGQVEASGVTEMRRSAIAHRSVPLARR